MTPRGLALIGLAVGLLAAGGPCAQGAEKPTRSRLCPEDAPEGVRLPPRPGCGSPEATAQKRDAGFRELVPGTGIRIGGRASATFGARR